MFGTIVYRNPEASYIEYLLADERGVRVIACMVASHPKLYRIEWPDEEDSTYIRNTAVYSLIDAMEVFEEKADRQAESDLDAQESAATITVEMEDELVHTEANGYECDVADCICH